jgi:hypothetical protein
MSPDGKLFATGLKEETTTDDGRAKISESKINLWTLPEAKLVSSLASHTGIVDRLLFTPDSKFLVSASDKRELIVWNLESDNSPIYLYDSSVSQSDPASGGSDCPSHSSGGYCSCNKVCTCMAVPSDREVKESFETTDAMTILQKLSELPIQKWNYKWDDESIRHIGPMAQDFAKAFEVGDSDKHIYPVDAQGIAFAAIQGLYRMLKEKDEETENLKTKLQLQQQENKELETRIEVLENLAKEKIK